MCFLVFFFDAAGSFFGFHSYPNLARGTGWCAPLYVGLSRRPAWFYLYVKGAVEGEGGGSFVISLLGFVGVFRPASSLMLSSWFLVID
ncbi:hypothetical protein PVK06_005306 [Gossypium arboreum]|uniref:Secreted protein n=1 Tax=Gossypium arboreum TaxID=29729 RepID=A0ABR0QU94_GOSAR|nr:hypothetical protein PVK06_005306 [Gossypium arboreum]